MWPPVVRINTFLQEKKNTNLDRISKIFIVFELLLGINRLPVFGNIKPVFIAFLSALSLSHNLLVIYLSWTTIFDGFHEIVKILKSFQYCLCALLGFAFRNRLSNFYCELNKFDKESGFRRVNKDIVSNVAHLCLTVGFLFTISTLLYVGDALKPHSMDVTIILLIHVTELHFFGHLFSLLIPRLRFINQLMKLSFENRSSIKTIENEMEHVKDRKHSCIEMKKFMDFYHSMIIAFDILNDAIKWQMVIILVISFITSLGVSYNVTLEYIHGEYVAFQTFGQIAMASFETIPLFAPCRVVDAVHNEVRSLSEQLSSKLYENKIEKSNRAVAQALLALIEARDLSFSLLRIFDIDVSFPVKFLGLLVTYLIILLQFEKVINLDRAT